MEITPCILSEHYNTTPPLRQRPYNVTIENAIILGLLHRGVQLSLSEEVNFADSRAQCLHSNNFSAECQLQQWDLSRAEVYVFSALISSEPEIISED